MTVTNENLSVNAMNTVTDNLPVAKNDNTALANTPAGELLFDSTKFDRMQTVAKMMATSTCTIPRHLQGNVGDCFAVIMQAAQWGMNPFAVAQKTHLVNGALGYEAQLINAAIVSMHVTSDRFEYEYVGNWDAYRKSGFNKSAELGCGVNVGATLRGESTKRWLPAPLCMEQVGPRRNSPLWATNPMQQLAYLAVKYWARLYAPDAILGVYSDDELNNGMIDANGQTTVEAIPAMTTPKPERKTANRKLKDKLGISDKSDATDNQAKAVQVVAPAEQEAVKAQNTTVEDAVVLPNLVQLIQDAITKSGAPITMQHIEDFLRRKKVLAVGVRIDEIDKYPENWRNYLERNAESFVNEVAKEVVNLF